ncbi:MAG: dTDP-4-dehydrorhamnose reductase [Pseudomonadota bacterium]
MILVFGKTGQVATELQRQADVTALGRAEADLSDPAACAAAITAHKPAMVINAAAYTAVDRAEEEEALATRVNAEAPGAMAEACAGLEIPFVHISTDYVFDGSGDGPWASTDPKGPLSAYGRTKLAGEEAVRAAGGVHAILRTAWVFSAHGNNFLKTMLRLSETRDHLTIVADQFGGPTPAAGIAGACLTIAKSLEKNIEKSNTYHYSGAPDVSWADFAREIFAQAGRGVSVEDIPSSSYPTPAKRPSNSRLDCASLLDAFGINRPDWKVHVGQVLEELGAKAS